jgi:hypothetical protein
MRRLAWRVNGTHDWPEPLCRQCLLSITRPVATPQRCLSDADAAGIALGGQMRSLTLKYPENESMREELEHFEFH